MMSTNELLFEDREALLERWRRTGCQLQAVFIGANVGLRFTGRIAETGCAELRLVRDDDELSINLLGARVEEIRKIEQPESAKEYFASTYFGVLQVVVDSG